MVNGSSRAPLELGPALSPATLRRIRRTLELHHQKWDTQVGDVSGLARAPLLIKRAAWQELAGLAQALFAETLALEEELRGRPELMRELGVPAALRELLGAEKPLTPAAARSMRFDFHPTADGWRVSEVNSDVPGGYSEASHFTRLVAAELPGLETPGDPTASLVEALARAADGRPVALICAPGFLEDQQVVSHLAASLRARGAPAALASLDQLTWRGGRAHLDLASRSSREVGAIFRFFQAEWLTSLPAESWRGLFVEAVTPVVNPAVAALSESKRLPLVWERLGAKIPTWRRLLPETRELGAAPWASSDDWLIKSAYSNNGDTVSIRAALSAGEWRRRQWQARSRPRAWLAQRRFDVLPLKDAEGALSPCVGVYVVNGKAAGAYTRVTRGSHVDFAAQDAALLISSDG